MKHEDALAECSDYEISLTKVLGKKVKDIRGYVTREFDSSVFCMTRVEFDDGTFLGCEGEHDLPYLVDWGRPDSPERCNEYSEETLDEIYESDPDYEPDDV